MRARTRFLLDIVLMIALVAAYKPTWTGITFHQWLSISIIVPLLLHVVVNWDWAVRILSTFIDRLIHTSRLNFVVDVGLLVSTVAVMLSGFMVSPILIAPFGIHPANALVWHFVHVWTANATILLLAIHGALHWRWFLSTAKRLAEAPTPARSRAVALVAARRTAATASAASADVTARSRRNRIGERRAQAARERATAMRTASVLGVTGALGVAIFAGVGMASPLLAHAAQPQRMAKTGLEVCPQTGCTASTCHGTTGADPNTFYRLKKAATKKKAKKAKSTVASATSARRVASATSAKTAKRTTTVAHVAGVASPSSKPKAKASGVAHTAVKKTVMTCPQTGCTASSCHGAHHQSASSYYH